MFSHAVEEHLRRLDAYMAAAETQRAGVHPWKAPPWVPSRITLTSRVRGDVPIAHESFAGPGDVDCTCNRWGAISVEANNHTSLGVKPSECQVLEWRENVQGWQPVRYDAVGKRLILANDFILVLASHGRKFFRYVSKSDDVNRVAWIERDIKGKLWHHDEYSMKRIYVSNPQHPWHGFSHGGTLRAVVCCLVEFVRTGKQFMVGGSHWGYGVDEMAKVVEAGLKLGVLAPNPGDLSRDHL